MTDREHEDPIDVVLSDGPLAARCERVRDLPADGLGPRALARERISRRMLVVRAFAVSDESWASVEPRLAALAEVRHKKISDLVAFGRHEQVAYVAHEHVDGRRLTDVLSERGVLSLPELVPIVSQILMGVGDAHLRGMVVGPITLHDVTLHDDAGRSMVVKLRNFGVYPVMGALEDPTSSGASDGLTDFRAPEDDPLAAPSSDVFSLGALILRMLSGPLPSSTTSADRGATLRARLDTIRHGDSPPPDALLDLLHRSLDPDPDGRPNDANQLVEELIDAVPMSAFRLPRVGEEPSRDPASTTTSASTMMLFTGRWKEIAQEHSGTPAGEPVDGALDERTSSAEEIPAPPGLAVLPAAAPRSGGRGWLVGLGALLLAAGGTLLALRGSTPEPTPAPEPIPVAAPAAVSSETLARSAPTPAPTGRVVVRSSPPGALFIDGEPAGDTPYDGPLAVGRHALRVESPGHEAWREEVDVTAGGTQRFDATLIEREPVEPEPEPEPEPEAEPSDAPEAAPSPSPRPRKRVKHGGSKPGGTAASRSSRSSRSSVLLGRDRDDDPAETSTSPSSPLLPRGSD
ncbi:MAG: PEGA domain-containing protein [Nannocystaceae bacterium]